MTRKYQVFNDSIFLCVTFQMRSPDVDILHLSFFLNIPVIFAFLYVMNYRYNFNSNPGRDGT